MLGLGLGCWNSAFLGSRVPSTAGSCPAEEQEQILGSRILGSWILGSWILGSQILGSWILGSRILGFFPTFAWLAATLGESRHLCMLRFLQL